jgi:hypothetical protein
MLVFLGFADAPAPSLSAFNASRLRQSPGGAADPPCAAKALEAFAACVLQRFSISKYFLIDA